MRILHKYMRTECALNVSHSLNHYCSLPSKTMDDCCKQGFLWNGTPTGKEEQLGDLDVYISGDKTKNAILLCHDAIGWKLNNIRLL